MRVASREFLFYGLASGLALALDLACYWASLSLGASIASAAAFGFIPGLLLMYLLSTRWVFSHRRLTNDRLEFFGFAVIGLFGLLLTEVMLWLLAGRLHWQPMPAKLASTAAVFLSNFTLRKHFLFRRHRRQSIAI